MYNLVIDVNLTNSVMVKIVADQGALPYHVLVA